MVKGIGKAKYISTLDPDSWEITAFSTPWGLYHFMTLPLGLHRAPVTFQWLMGKVLHPHWAYVAAYLDDMVIFTNTWADYL